ncbi:MAG: hypothetical protein HOW71_01830, partial [Nonomuraea sp.]|nr:hypothetical protein [Nonomuraea sp.]
PNERRSTDALTRRAGIHPFRLKATPGHPRLAEVTGARTPSGEAIPVWEPDVRKPLRPRREGGLGGAERRGGRRGPRREFDGERRPRRHDEGPFVAGEDRRPRRHEEAGGEDRRPRRHGEGERPYGQRSSEPRTFGNDRRGGDRPRGGYDRPARQDDRGGFRSEDRPARQDDRGGFRSDERPARQDDGGFRADGPRGGGFRDGQRSGGFRSDDRGRYTADRGRPFSGDRDRGVRSDERAPRDGYRSGEAFRAGGGGAYRPEERGNGGFRRNNGGRRFER